MPPTTPLHAVPVSPDPTARATPAPIAVQPYPQAWGTGPAPQAVHAYAPPQAIAPVAHMPPQAYAPPQAIVPAAHATPQAYAPPPGPVLAYDATPAPLGSVDMSEAAPRADVAHAVLDVADRIDAALYGKRRVILVVLSFLVAALSWWEADRTPHDLRWTAFGTLVLAVYLEVLFLARIGSFRDDSKRWSAQLVRDRFGAWWEDVVESAKDARALPASGMVRGVGTFLAGLAIVVLALRNVVLLTQVVLAEFFSARSPTLASIDSVTRIAGLVGLVLGLALWLVGVWLARQGKNAERFTVHENERAALARTADALPPGVLDCADQGAIERVVKATPHPLFAELLLSLSAWKPRSQSTEAGYTSSLVRKLRERMPGAAAERERPLRDDKQRFRADLIVGDAVLVEMKRGLSTSTAQKALGQVQMYARAWAQRGPVLLLICGVRREVAEQHLGKHLGLLRQLGVVVAVVAR